MPYFRPMIWRRRNNKFIRRKKTTRRRVTKPVKTFVKKEINKRIETKYAERLVNIGGSSFNDFGSVSEIMPSIPQGITDSNRVGDKITLTSLSFRISLASVNPHSYCRIIVFQWKDSTIPVSNDILFPTLEWNGYYSKDKRERFNVLMDKTYTLVSGDYRPVLTFYKKVPLKYCRKTLQYISGAANYPGYNSIYILAISDIANSPYPSAEMRVRCYYKDA